MKVKLLGVLCGVVILVGLPTLANAMELTFETTFPFSVDKKVNPAGRYELSGEPGEGAMTLRAEDKGVKAEGEFIKVMTLLSDVGAKEAKVVFDKVGEEYRLAEVYAPGEEAAAFAMTPGKHTHVKVAATAKTKAAKPTK